MLKCFLAVLSRCSASDPGEISSSQLSHGCAASICALEATHKQRERSFPTPANKDIESFFGDLRPVPVTPNPSSTLVPSASAYEDDSVLGMELRWGASLQQGDVPGRHEDEFSAFPIFPMHLLTLCFYSRSPLSCFVVYANLEVFFFLFHTACS